LRALLEAADGLLIATPEYAHSMPGVLKNALDWLVASGELSGMPIALMSASTTTGGGIRAQMALTQTLLAQAGHVAVGLTVPGVKTKLDASGEIADPATLRRIRETLVVLAEAVDERRASRGAVTSTRRCGREGRAQPGHLGCHPDRTREVAGHVMQKHHQQE
jgi:chromate reductase, NAD(P)H dehydrogenase (quinone)